MRRDAATVMPLLEELPALRWRRDPARDPSEMALRWEGGPEWTLAERLAAFDHGTIDGYALETAEGSRVAAWLTTSAHEDLLAGQASRPRPVGYMAGHRVWMFQDRFFGAEAGVRAGDLEAWVAEKDIAAEIAAQASGPCVDAADGRSYPATVEAQGPVSVERLSLAPSSRRWKLVAELRNLAKGRRELEAEVLVRTVQGRTACFEHDIAFGVPAGGRAIIALDVALDEQTAAFDLIVHAR